MDKGFRHYTYFHSCTLGLACIVLLSKSFNLLWLSGYINGVNFDSGNGLLPDDIIQYLNQCWLLFREFLLDSHENYLGVTAQHRALCNTVGDYTFRVLELISQGPMVLHSIDKTHMLNEKQRWDQKHIFIPEVLRPKVTYYYNTHIDRCTWAYDHVLSP